MNVKELKNILKNLSDDCPIAISLSDGTLDFVVFAYESEDDSGEVLIINGN